MAENGEKTMVPADGEEPVDTAEKLLQLIADKERLAKFRYILYTVGTTLNMYWTF